VFLTDLFENVGTYIFCNEVSLNVRFFSILISSNVDFNVRHGYRLIMLT
jgi:hypothetical protein